VTPAYDCKTAQVAAIIEPTKGEFYIMLGRGDHTCERWRIDESLARKLRKELNQKLD